MALSEVYSGDSDGAHSDTSRRALSNHQFDVIHRSRKAWNSMAPSQRLPRQSMGLNWLCERTVAAYNDHGVIDVLLEPPNASCLRKQGQGPK